MGWVVFFVIIVIVIYRGRGVRMVFSEVVRWLGLCFLVNMLLCIGIIVCKVFVLKLGIVFF